MFHKKSSYKFIALFCYNSLEQISDVDLFNAIKKLKPEQIEILIKIAVEDKNQVEIAEQMNISKRVVNYKLQVIKQKINEFLKES